MRDLGDMIQRVRRKCGDYADEQITEPVIETALEVAADQVWDDLLTDTEGRECLRAYSEPVYMIADIEEYELPGRCMQMRSLEYKPRPAEKRWRPLERRSPPDGAVPGSGSAELFGSSGSGAAVPLFWSDDAAPGYIRVWPALRSVNGQQIRFMYYRRPRFPQYTTGTFNNPDAYGAVEANLPERVTEAVEWGAALELATDNTGAQVSVDAATRSYYRALHAVIRTGYVTSPVRRYIKRVNING